MGRARLGRSRDRDPPRLSWPSLPSIFSPADFDKATLPDKLAGRDLADAIAGRNVRDRELSGVLAIHARDVSLSRRSCRRSDGYDVVAYKRPQLDSKLVGLCASSTIRCDDCEKGV